VGSANLAQFTFVDAVGDNGLDGVLAGFELRPLAFSGVSGFSSRISTYLLRGMAFSPSGRCM
jgi:hypothetical protein